MGSLTEKDVYNIISSFIDGSINDSGWDGFLYASIKDPYLKEIRDECAVLWEKYPPQNPNEYCNQEGLKVLKNILSDLKSKIETEKQKK